MAEFSPAPRISKLSWGRIEIESGSGFKDVKLYPGGAREWDWGETGTSHSPGIQPADVEELLEHGARAVILSKGRLGRLGICSETLELLESRGIAVRILKTEQAVEVYNDLRERQPVGGLFHTTC